MRKIIISAFLLIVLNSNGFAQDNSTQTWEDQMKIEIDKSYQNKEITKYEYLDLLIKLQQYKVQWMGTFHQLGQQGQ